MHQTYPAFHSTIAPWLLALLSKDVQLHVYDDLPNSALGACENKFPKGHLGPLGLSAEPAKLGSAETKPCGRHRPIAMQDFCTGQPQLLELFVNRLIAGCARARPCVGSLRLVCLRWEMPIEGSLRSFRDLCKGMRGFRCQNPRALGRTNLKKRQGLK